MRLTQFQLPELGVEITQDGYDWDFALSPSEKNPFPLAPPDLVRLGKVDQKSYDAQNNLIGDSAFGVMVPELRVISQEPGFLDGPRRIECLGGGHGRDLRRWLKDPVMGLFLPVGITDSSKVSKDILEEMKDQEGLPIEVCLANVEEAWGDLRFIDDESTLVYYGHQFIQNQKKRAKDRIMKRLGRFLAMQTPDGQFHRRVYLFHARGEDNAPERVEWRNTIPWENLQLLIPLQIGFRAGLKKGLMASVVMEAIATHWYWHQCYTWFRLRAVPEGAPS